MTSALIPADTRIQPTSTEATLRSTWHADEHLIVTAEQTRGTDDKSRRSLPHSTPPLLGPGSGTSSLLATVAHEFRTPLAALQVTLELLAEPAALPPAEARQLVQRLQRSVHWLSGMVGNLELWAAVDAGHLPGAGAPVAVSVFVEDARSLVQPILAGRHQRVRVTSPPISPRVRGDRRLLSHVLVNLLTNASHYSPAAAEIRVAVASLPDWVEIRVTNSGPGIPLAEQARIFNRAVRGASSARHPEGVGLGLYLVRRLVELHGGTVGVDSVPARRASFWIRLPPLPEEAR